MTFQVTLKAGRNTSTLNLEAKSLQNLLTFCSTVLYAEVREVKQVVYSKDITPPVDDPLLYKGITKVLATTADKFQNQFIFSYIKSTVSREELITQMKTHLEVADKPISAITNFSQKLKSF